MRIRVIDFDGSITAQDRLLRKYQPDVYDLRPWGPRLRLASTWARYYRLERRLDRLFGPRETHESRLSLLGSGDFHHVTLALLRRVRQPFNLLLLDHDADWRRGLPMIASNNWLNQAVRLPNLRRIFLAGVTTRLDNASRWLAPRTLIESGKLIVLPALERFVRGFWRKTPHQPLRRTPETLIDRDRLEEVLWPFLDELDRAPLYISLDKSVLWMPESVTNSHSGVLDLNELEEILQFFLKAAGNDLAGMDIVGDWSPVETSGLLRYFLHRWQHPLRTIDAQQARLCNERTNLTLLRFISQEPEDVRMTFRPHLKSA